MFDVYVLHPRIGWMDGARYLDTFQNAILAALAFDVPAVILGPEGFRKEFRPDIGLASPIPH